ncbi:hypothetical protein, partial [Actinocatenispora comari]|uniref:hypothetical protein n=1 Tax=Actinocatenispora comari TaxID=2807577 RepID=UPI001A90FA03
GVPPSSEHRRGTTHDAHDSLARARSLAHERSSFVGTLRPVRAVLDAVGKPAYHDGNPPKALP